MKINGMMYVVRISGDSDELRQFEDYLKLYGHSTKLEDGELKVAVHSQSGVDEIGKHLDEFKTFLRVKEAMESNREGVE